MCKNALHIAHCTHFEVVTNGDKTLEKNSCSAFHFDADVAMKFDSALSKWMLIID